MNNNLDRLAFKENKVQKAIRFSPYLLWAFTIPAALFLIIYLIRGVFPIGENSVLVLDLNAQYVYFFEELRDIMLGEGSLLYSWQRAVGGEFMGMYAYYLASPFNFIIALFPEKFITEALLTIFVLKAGLSGFNFAVYLHYSGRAKNRYATVIFSTMYALTSYAIVNAHNTMWIDALLFLPLIILGLESLINRKKYILYTVVLAVTVISNFYIGYMVCIFIAAYAVYYYFAYGYSPEYNESGESNHLLKSFFRVLLFSVLALAMAAVIIFTTYYSLKFGKNEFSDPSYDLTSKFNYFDMLAKFFPNSYDTVRPEGLPFVYCGVLCLILLPIYFFTKKVSPREKICSGILLSVLLFSFAASTVDIFWHGMQNPNWLNYRYSFMLCFLMVTLSHQAFFFVKEVKFNHIVAVCVALIGVLVLIQNDGLAYVDSVLCIWLSMMCISVYLFTLYAHHKEKGTEFTALILAILVCTELLINGYVSLDDLDTDVIFSSRTSYRTYIDEVTPLVDFVHQRDDSFYRMEKTTHRKTNDNFTLNMNGLTNSTSTLNTSIINLLNQLGYSSKSHWSKYLGGTAFSDSLLGLKYIISDKVLNEQVLDKIHTTQKYLVYENPYAMSLAFGVSNDFQTVSFSSYTNPFDLANAIVTAMLGEEETVMLFKAVEGYEEVLNNTTHSLVTSEYHKYEPTDKSGKAKLRYTFEAPTSDELFFFYPSDYPRKVNLLLDGRDWGTFFDNETDRVISLESYDAGEQVSLVVTLEDDCLYLLREQKYFYYLDTELYKSVMERLNESRYDIQTHSDTYFDGTITVNEGDTLLFTSIPYDEGWHVLCDGKEMPLVKTADSLLAASVPEGTHRLELKYLPDCYVYGSIVAISGFTIFILIIITDFFIKRSRKKAQANISQAINEFYEGFEFPKESKNANSAQSDEQNNTQNE